MIYNLINRTGFGGEEPFRAEASDLEHHRLHRKIET
jgi:hypothetical protein